MPPFVSRTICRSGVAVRHQTVHLCQTAPLWIELGEDRVQPHSWKELQFPFPVPVFTGAADLGVDSCPSRFLYRHNSSAPARLLFPSDVHERDLVIRILGFDLPFGKLDILHADVNELLHVVDGSRPLCNSLVLHQCLILCHVTRSCCFLFSFEGVPCKLHVNSTLSLSASIFTYRTGNNARENKNAKKSNPSPRDPATIQRHRKDHVDEQRITDTACSDAQSLVRTQDQHGNTSAEQAKQWNQNQNPFEIPNHGTGEDHCHDQYETDKQSQQASATCNVHRLVLVLSHAPCCSPSSTACRFDSEAVQLLKHLVQLFFLRLIA